MKSWRYLILERRVPNHEDLHEPTFKAAAGEPVFSKARVINTLGNRAVHSYGSVQQADATAAVRELFHVTYWFARTYARGSKPAPGLPFDPDVQPKAAPITKRPSSSFRSWRRDSERRTSSSQPSW